MIVSRVYEPALAQVSYLIGCQATGQALVIDPNRDVDRYLEEAAREGLTITHVTETHIHADFLSGARELAARTGARLYLSDEGDADWKYRFASEGRLIRHGDRLQIGRVAVDVVATPGHTPEHLTFLITDTAAADRPLAAATGDFLFVGDVGRPDLLERAAHVSGTMEAMARTLWRSLQAFNVHEDWLQIWPGHGAGSACGKGISSVPFSTLGYERRFNWAFRIASEQAFVDEVLTGQPEPPRYFATMKRLNQAGPPRRRAHAAPRLDDRHLLERLAAGALVVDPRPAGAYAAAHLPGTINIPLDRQFVTWAGWLLPYNTDLHVIAGDPADATAREAVRQLALIGLDDVAGVVDGGVVERAAAAGRVIGAVPQAAPRDVAARLAAGSAVLVDVRSQAEWQAGHIAEARHVPLGDLADQVGEIPADRTVVVQCQSGARSAIAASVLRRAGRDNVLNLVGGLAAWVAAGLPVVRPGASTT